MSKKFTLRKDIINQNGGIIYPTTSLQLTQAYPRTHALSLPLAGKQQFNSPIITTLSNQLSPLSPLSHMTPMSPIHSMGQMQYMTPMSNVTRVSNTPYMSPPLSPIGHSVVSPRSQSSTISSLSNLLSGLKNITGSAGIPSNTVANVSVGLGSNYGNQYMNGVPRVNVTHQYRPKSNQGDWFIDNIFKNRFNSGYRPTVISRGPDNIVLSVNGQKYTVTKNGTRIDTNLNDETIVIIKTNSGNLLVKEANGKYTLPTYKLKNFETIADKLKNDGYTNIQEVPTRSGVVIYRVYDNPKKLKEITDSPGVIRVVINKFDENSKDVIQDYLKLQ
jgi:hypothetical protein